jgi:hypothetical protein
MGLLINGEWQEHKPGMTKDGHFERLESAFQPCRAAITGVVQKVRFPGNTRNR